MIDYHSHILPQVDDGPKELSDALQMARALSAAGFTEVWCTPHMIRGAYDNRPADIRDRVAALEAACLDNGITLKLRSGMEYYLDEYLPAIIQDPLPIGNDRYILAELPLQTTFHVVEALTSRIIAGGFVPLIAHPERSPLLIAALAGNKVSIGSRLGNFFSRSNEYPERTSPVLSLLSKGCRFQGNIGSFAGIYGEKVRAAALKLLEMDAYSCLGSDAHRADRLDATLTEGLAVVRRRIGSEASGKLLGGELLSQQG